VNWLGASELWRCHCSNSWKIRCKSSWVLHNFSHNHTLFSLSLLCSKSQVFSFFMFSPFINSVINSLTCPLFSCSPFFLFLIIFCPHRVVFTFFSCSILHYTTLIMCTAQFYHFPNFCCVLYLQLVCLPLIHLPTSFWIFLIFLLFSSFFFF
jgi:hypothetical protein